MSITVCIGTFGRREPWVRLARDRASVSAHRQTVAPVEVIHRHETSLQDARNHAAADATGNWLCFLDADDELDERYIEAMTQVARRHHEPALIQPSTLGIHPDGREDDVPVLIPARPLLDGNFMVIGTLIRRDQFLRLGGFGDFECYEDWELWIRAWRDGARLVSCPKAIYRVHVSDRGRNNTDLQMLQSTYRQIQRRHAGTA